MTLNNRDDDTALLDLRNRIESAAAGRAEGETVEEAIRREFPDGRFGAYEHERQLHIADYTARSGDTGLDGAREVCRGTGQRWTYARQISTRVLMVLTGLNGMIAAVNAFTHGPVFWVTLIGCLVGTVTLMVVTAQEGE